MCYQAIEDLLGYALRTGLIEKCDRTWAANRLLQPLGLESWEAAAVDTDSAPPLQHALTQGDGHHQLLRRRAAGGNNILQIHGG